MKKRVLCSLLVLCMICSLLSTSVHSLNVEPALEEITFGYAYDAQRSPSYPEGANTQIEFDSFSKPLIHVNGTRKDVHTGSWTLHRAGTYAYLKSINKDSSELFDVMESIADEYHVNIDEILTYELKDNGSHIAYGVVIAYNAEAGYAAFIGDTHWTGAGYLLSKNEITVSSIAITADKIATDFVPSLSIALDKTGTQAFESKNAGYQQSDLEALTVTVSNTGNAATGALNVALSGTNADSFTLDGVDAVFQAGIAKDSNDTFTVTPKTGLSTGIYTATVTVSGVDVASQSFDVTFTVNTPTYTVTVDGGTGDGVYAEGAVVTITADAAPNGKRFKEWTGVDGLTFTNGNKTTETATFTMPGMAVSVTATYEAMALEDVTFGYAYDAYRSPSYPQGADTQIEFDNFRKPLLDISGTRKDVNTGSWTLSRAGTYFYLKSVGKDTVALSGIMETIANEYNVNKDEILVYALKDNGSHIAYGVVIAYNAEEGYAAFIGDTYYGGAGYLLSLDEITKNSITITADMVATDFVPSRSITLDKTGTQTFEGETAGYQHSDLTALTVTVTNTGNTGTGALNVSLSGINADSFTLSDVDTAFQAGIAKDNNDTFTVVPKADLSAGTYTATVTVSGVDVASQSFNVTFTVNAPTYTVTYKADGVVVGTQTIEHGKDATAPQIPAKTGYDQTAPQWDKDGKNITADTEINAVYTINTYTVTLKVDGKVFDTITVKHGESVTLPEPPAKDGYSVKWDWTIVFVAADMTVNAVYTPNTSTPVTGDTFDAFLWMSIMGMSAVALAVLLIDQKKRRTAK